MNTLSLTLTPDNFAREVLESDVPVLVDIWAEWCAPCRAIAPLVEALAAKHQGKAKVGKLNVDTASELIEDYGVSSIPTLLFFKDGAVVDRIVGAVPQQAMEDKLTELM